MTARWGTYGGSPALLGDTLIVLGGDCSAIQKGSNLYAPANTLMSWGEIRFCRSRFYS
jgi:hypothetical protein